MCISLFDTENDEKMTFQNIDGTIQKYLTRDKNACECKEKNKWEKETKIEETNPRDAQPQMLLSFHIA